AEEAEQKLIGSEQSVWLERLSTEYDNMRAVLNWTLGKDAEIGLRLAGALGNFWLLRSFFGEARKWLTNVLEANDSLAPRAQRAKVLNTAGSIVYRQGEYASATSLSEQALTSCRELGDKQGIATALSNLGNVAFQQGDYATARSLQQESLAIRRGLGDK